MSDHDNCKVCNNDLTINQKVALLCDSFNNWHCFSCMGVAKRCFDVVNDSKLYTSMVKVVCKQCLKDSCQLQITKQLIEIKRDITKKNRRGICLYCKPEFKYNVIKNILEFEESVACEFIGQTEIFLLVICYRSPNSTLCNDQKLFDLLLDLAQINYNNTFIVGDFNYCTIDWNLRVIRSYSEIATRFMTTINDLFLEHLLSEPTRYRVGQKENILDLVLTNNLYFVESVDYCDPLGMSDHVSLLIYLNFESTRISKLPKRMYYNGKYILMNELINGFTWTLLMDALNTQECWDLFTVKVDYAIEKLIQINDKNKSTSKDCVNSKVRYERKKKKTGMVKTMETIRSVCIMYVCN